MFGSGSLPPPELELDEVLVLLEDDVLVVPELVLDVPELLDEGAPPLEALLVIAAAPP